MEKELITEDIKAALREAFKELRDDVLIEVYTKIGENDMFNDLAVDLIEAMAEASSKIKIKLYKLGDENSKNKDVHRSPTILIAPDNTTSAIQAHPLVKKAVHLFSQ